MSPISLEEHVAGTERHQWSDCRYTSALLAWPILTLIDVDIFTYTTTQSAENEWKEKVPRLQGGVVSCRNDCS